MSAGAAFFQRLGRIRLPTRPRRYKIGAATFVNGSSSTRSGYEINAGGILGTGGDLYEDDKTNPDAAVNATRKLIERDHVLAVIGPITSRNLNAIKPEIERAKTPLLYATNYEGGACGRYIFVFSTVPNQELAQLLPYMNETFGNTYYLLGADRAWPHKMFEAAEPMISALGGRVVGKEFTTGNEKDFTPLIKRIAAAKPKVLLFAKGLTA